MTWLAKAKAQFKRTVNDRRYLHQNPELSNQEEKTAAYLNEQLEKAGFVVETGIGGHGLIGTLDTGQPGPVFMLRFDMDALPVQEENDFQWKSVNAGVMHACGHDGHMSVGLTIARLIVTNRSSLKGKFCILFQPAEEIGLGALAMVEDGVLERYQPDFILGAHLWNEKPTGWLGIRGGPLMAGSGIFEIEVRGKGGHGGMPQLTVDPILAAAQLVNDLQGVVSRNFSPFEPAVLSICSIQGGSAYNVIPSSVTLKGTIRYFSAEAYALIKDRMYAICEGLARSSQCQIDLYLEGLVNPTTNHEQVAKIVQTAAQQLEADLTVDTSYQTTLSEDFGVFLDQRPGCFILVGAGANPDGNEFGHHHPKFEFDENAMTIAVALLLQSCQRLADEVTENG